MPPSPLPFAEEARARLGAPLFRYLLGRPAGMDEAAADANEAAFRRYTLLPRVMTGVAEARTEARFFGADLAAPLGVGAYAGDVVFSEGGLLPLAGLLCRMRLPLFISEETVTPLAALTEAHDLCWLQLRAAGPLARVCDLAGEAAAAGARGLVLTVLAPVHPRPGLQPGGFDIGAELRRRGLPTIGSGGAPGVLPLPAFPQWGWGEIEAVARCCAGLGLPLLLKGILDPADVAPARAAGAAGVIASNIGLRQIGRWPAVPGRVPLLRAAAAPGMPLLLDGGVRSGLDLLIARLLGADLALTTRPVVTALATGGPARLEAMLGAWIDELAAACAWMGAAHPDALSPSQLIAPAAQ